MLSTITLISIFTEIFAAGILILGALTFAREFLSSRQLKQLYFGLTFLSLFANVGATIASQLMFNLGMGLSELILVQKIVYGSMVLCSLFLWLYIVEKFDQKRIRFLSFFVLLVMAYLAYLIVNSSVSLVYREGVIEPIVNFYPWIPIKPFLALLWGILAATALSATFSTQGGKKKLLQYTGFSSVLMLGSVFSSYLYIRTGEGNYLLASWIILLFAI